MIRTIHLSMIARKHAQSVAWCIRHLSMLVVRYSGCSQGQHAPSDLIARKRAATSTWDCKSGLTGLGIAIVLLAMKRWMLAGLSHVCRTACSDARAGWKQAACTEAPGVRIPDPAILQVQASDHDRASLVSKGASVRENGCKACTRKSGAPRERHRSSTMAIPQR